MVPRLLIHLRPLKSNKPVFFPLTAYLGMFEYRQVYRHRDELARRQVELVGAIAIETWNETARCFSGKTAVLQALFLYLVALHSWSRPSCIGAQSDVCVQLVSTRRHPSPFTSVQLSRTAIYKVECSNSTLDGGAPVSPLFLLRRDAWYDRVSIFFLQHF